MDEIISKHKLFWKKKEFFYPVLTSLIFLAISLVINHLAAIYTYSSDNTYVHDLLWDHLPVMDVDGILNYGLILFILILLGYALAEPKRLSFGFKTLALFIVIRAVFTTFTHLGPAPVHTPIDPNYLLSDLLFGNDFFFSGHTGIPFLMALIFWNNKIIRYISLAGSVLFGACVILGRLHYSIDVFAAFFITYTIFHIATKLFPGDYKLLQEEN